MIAADAGRKIGTNPAINSLEHASGPRAEVVERTESEDKPEDRSRHTRLADVGVMHFSTDEIAVNRGVERRLNLLSSARECDPRAAAGDLVDGESLGLDPGSDLGQIIRTQAEPVSKLLRRQPAMVVRRRRILLLAEQAVEVGLLARGRLKHELDPLQPERVLNRSLVELRPRLRPDVALQHRHLCAVDRPHQTVSNWGLADEDGRRNKTQDASSKTAYIKQVRSYRHETHHDLGS